MPDSAASEWEAAHTAFAEITLRSDRHEVTTRFEVALAELSSVLECHRVGGRFDYLAKIAVSNTADLPVLISKLLNSELGICSCVVRMMTRTVFERPQ
ncbi:Lrp/AsnC ligand binding domain-containing protein [Paraburkholderia caribensis]|uniref:Lrp/AsnC ligand binding domain-containing protein n=1 Tax=Paraburkholderia caribensis TaxID=75105 RepID=UPI0034D1A5AF